jgi:hypothetical protein
VTASAAACVCSQCGGPVLVAGTGRPPKYCCPACRQAAYRGRQATAGGSGGDAERARALVSMLAGAAGQLAHAVASQATGETSVLQAAAQQGASALAELTELAGLTVPARDVTPEGVTEPGSAPAQHATSVRHGSRFPEAVTAWARSPDRATWVASTAAGVRLAVTRQVGGSWLPAVQRPGAADMVGPTARTRIAAQRWAEQRCSLRPWGSERGNPLVLVDRPEGE